MKAGASELSRHVCVIHHHGAQLLVVLVPSKPTGLPDNHCPRHPQLIRALGWAGACAGCQLVGWLETSWFQMASPEQPCSAPCGLSPTVWCIHGVVAGMPRVQASIAKPLWG